MRVYHNARNIRPIHSNIFEYRIYSKPEFKWFNISSYETNSSLECLIIAVTGTMKHCDLSSNDPSLSLQKVATDFSPWYCKFAAFEYNVDDQVVILNAHRDPCGIQIKSGSR